MCLSPPIPALLPCAVGPGGIIICGEDLPLGASVSVPNSAIFRNVAYSDRPHNFVPEQWMLSDEEEEELSRVCVK